MQAQLQSAEERPFITIAAAVAANEHLQSVLAAVPDAMVIIDREGCIAAFSPAAERMFGYSPGELVGENVSVLMPSPDRERHDGYLRRYHGNREPRVIGIGRVTTAQRKDGSTFPIELSVGEAHIAGHQVFTGFVRDLSEVKQNQRLLHNLQAEASHFARASQLGSLASAIAHELNQPLSAVTNYADAAYTLLESNSPDRPRILSAIRSCADEAERAGQVVHHLRQFFSRGETGKSRVDLGRLVEEAIAIATSDRRARTTALSIHVDKHASVLADRLQIQQVLVNLIRNAVEATEGSSGQTVQVHGRLADNETIEVSVEDSGSGIDPRFVRHLFHPLLTSKPNGMGLGLSICQKIVGAHGGRIWADKSALGGAAFHFTLPRFPAEQGADR